ncbi:tyrosine-protein phosphatase [Rheinheimera sp.]|uniref:tyrosine-protein phosphatase n=1 Tax=Rheinheimera sp. TaxID=1869214 RepID=UPI00307D509A
MNINTITKTLLVAVSGFSFSLLAASSDFQTGNERILQSAGAVMVKQDKALLPQSVLVSWSASLGPVTLYRASSPDQSKMELVAEKLNGNSYLLPAKDAQRQYVFIKPQQQEGYWVAERVLPLQGGVNFRDLGGYKGADGRAVVWGKLFRSGSMSDLTGADYQYLSALGIRTFCDFRSNEERTDEPTLYKEFAPEAQMLVKDYSMAQMMNAEFGKALAQVQNREQALQMFSGFYRKGVTSYAGQFKQMFAQLLAGKAPLAVNCSAGKDRTGMASALILSALGVPRDVVVADYALSEQTYDFGMQALKKMASGGAKEQSPHTQMFRQLKPEVIQVMMGTDPALITAFFQQIDQDYGSVEHYLQKELGLTPASLETLRSLYLTKV